MLSYQANHEIINHEGQSPLDIAVQYKQKEIVRLFSLWNAVKHAMIHVDFVVRWKKFLEDYEASLTVSESAEETASSIYLIENTSKLERESRPGFLLDDPLLHELREDALLSSKGITDKHVSHTVVLSDFTSATRPLLVTPVTSLQSSGRMPVPSSTLRSSSSRAVTSSSTFSSKVQTRQWQSRSSDFYNKPRRLSAPVLRAMSSRGRSVTAKELLSGDVDPRTTRSPQEGGGFKSSFPFTPKPGTALSRIGSEARPPAGQLDWNTGTLPLEMSSNTICFSPFSGKDLGHSLAQYLGAGSSEGEGEGEGGGGGDRGDRPVSVDGGLRGGMDLEDTMPLPAVLDGDGEHDDESVIGFDVGDMDGEGAKEWIEEAAIPNGVEEGGRKGREGPPGEGQISEPLSADELSNLSESVSGYDPGVGAAVQVNESLTANSGHRKPTSFLSIPYS